MPARTMSTSQWNCMWRAAESRAGEAGYFSGAETHIFCSIMTDRKAVIKNADMSEDMQQDAVDCATQAMEKYNIEKDIAAYVKKEFDKKYNPTWHCIVGRNFGSYVTHETKHFIYFYLGQVAILLFKSG
ncbi:dynein, light chain, LC8-type 2a isoform X2 [Osmerus mordax]|uniref:dynein, light chain, LC8-type 2a isoform X2 n=1 Tax=Osmerus mordax TaxID=8014 RepID=UPI00350FB6E2